MKKTTKALFIILLVLSAVCLASCSLLGGGKSDGKSSGKKVALTESMVIGSPMKGTGTPVYTGSPITFPESSFSFYVNGNYPSSSDFTYTYETNVDAGENTAAVIITAKPENAYCTGSVKLRFSIAPGSITTGNRAELTALLENKNYSSVSFEGNGFIENIDTLAIPEGATLKLVGGALLTVKGQLVNNGTLIVDGSTYYNGGTRAGCLKNTGIVRNNGSVKVTSIGEIINEGQFFSEGTISNEGAVYTNDTALPGLTNVKTGAQYVRQEISADDLSFPYIDESGVEYSQSNGVSRPYVSVPNGSVCDVTYEGNDHAGTATVIVTPTEKDHYYYGSASKTFTIRPGVATVKNYAELTAASATFNFNRYEITGDIVVPADGTLYIHPHETLNFAGNALTINGACTNNGEIKSYKMSYGNVNEFTLNITVNDGGSFGGEGKLSAQKIKVTANGDFALQSPESTTFETFSQGKGTLSIGSDFTVPTLSISSGATLSVLSGGVVNCSTLSVVGGFECGGTINVDRQCSFHYDVERSIGNGGRLYLGTAVQPADTYFEYLNLLNGGIIFNYGDFVCDHVTKYYLSSQIHFVNTDGHVWTYEEFGNITENVTVKKKLSSTIVALEYTEVEYDTTDKRPLFTVEGVTPENINKNYTIKYRNSDNTIANSTRNVGEYVVSITVPASNKKYLYGGSVDLTFNIKKSTCHLTDTSRFNNVIGNDNYEKIMLETDVTVSTAYTLHNFTLKYGITLDTNGYTITVTNENNFVIEGELIISAPTGGRECSVLIQKGSNLRNHNVVTNNGVLCFDSPSEHYLTDGYANVTFINDGSVYGGTGGASYSFIQGNVTSGAGNVFVRTPLPEADLDIEYTETTYTGSDLTPVVSYTGSVLTPGAFDNFGKTYSNNRNAGAAAVTVKPDVLNETYYGSVTFDFTIKKAAHLITSGFLYQSDFSDPDNYSEVKLGQSAVITSTINVPAGMNFNYSYYTLSFENDATLVLEADSEIYAEARDKQSFIQNISNVQKILVTGDISDRISLSFAPNPNASLKRMFYYSNGNSYVGKLTVNSLTIDLCGHSLPGGLTFADNERNGFTVTFENSLYETVTSTIGTATAEDYGFFQQSTNKDTNFIFNHLTIAGIRLDGDTSGNETIVTGNYCTIVRNRANEQYVKGYALYVPNSMNADTNFNHCTFQATTDQLAYIRSGDHVWNDCNLTRNNIYYGPFDRHRPSITIDGTILPAAQ